MTAEDLKSLEAIVTKSRDKLASIRITKERLAWLEADESLYLAFDRGASDKANLSSQRVEIRPSTDTMGRLREMLLEELSGDLAKLEAEFEGLKVDLASKE